MNLLYSNDTLGQYPDSWYTATTPPLPAFAPLSKDISADVCIIGAGYTGLSAALTLAERGYDVVVLEAQRVGFGASGRNGGQLGSGQNVDQGKLERMMGADDANRLWRLSEDSKDMVKSLIAQHQIECHLKPGIAHMALTSKEMAALHLEAEYLSDQYGYDQINTLDKAQGQALCPSPVYHGGYLDHGAAHLHPLAFALGLARAAKAAGVHIYEQSEVTDMRKGTKPVITCRDGAVTCTHAILACNGYLGKLNRKVAGRVMPINNFIAATEPLGKDTAQVLTQDIAVADTKFVVNYFRLSHDGRLLFGGGENYSYRFPTNIAAKVRRPMQKIFPHLRDVKIDYAWGGTLAITAHRLPYLARLDNNILSASGYSGHGVGAATLSGKLMALAIAGQSEGFDTMARMPSVPFPGGKWVQSPLLKLAMTWYSLRDNLGI
ncbi:MAG: FAD-binding oxidoreductase [Paracoccaceae bacterium]|nr:FAD-binding oxidoreductase [Paracoccaceae bacterium]